MTFAGSTGPYRLRAAAALCAAAAGVLLTVHPASASPAATFTPVAGGGEFAPNATASDCLSGYTCWYGDGNYTGWILRYADVQTAKIAYPRAMSSWINRNSKNAAWFDGPNGSGTKHCMPAGAAVSLVLPAENDTMVSFKIYSGAC